MEMSNINELDHFKKKNYQELQEILFLATHEQDFRTMDLAIQAGANKNGKDKHGKTPYHYAAEQELASPTKAPLIIHGADDTIPDNNGITARSITERKFLELIELQIKYHEKLKKNL